MGTGQSLKFQQSIRFSLEETKLIGERTLETGETVSAYVRRLVREDGGGWIPVSERLPESNGNVLIYDEVEGVTSAEYYTSRGQAGEKVWVWYIRDGPMGKHVTHWQPLPAPPVRNENERCTG